MELQTFIYVITYYLDNNKSRIYTKLIETGTLRDAHNFANRLLSTYHLENFTIIDIKRKY